MKESLTSDPPYLQFGQKPPALWAWVAEKIHSMFVALGRTLGLVPSLPPARFRSNLFVLGVVLGISGIWMLLADLLSPKIAGLPFDRSAAEAAARHRNQAIVAAGIGGIRGDLWANAAFADARFLWVNRLTKLDKTSLAQLANAKANAETALALAPINGAAWLFLAKLPATSPDAESRGVTLLEMSYFTAPSAPELAPYRLERVASSSALADKDIQAFVKNDLREIMRSPPDIQQTILTVYRNALPQNQPILASLVADIDPAMAQMLRSPPPPK